jgi:hypothetical protein
VPLFGSVAISGIGMKGSVLRSSQLGSRRSASAAVEHATIASHAASARATLHSRRGSASRENHRADERGEREAVDGERQMEPAPHVAGETADRREAEHGPFVVRRASVAGARRRSGGELPPISPEIPDDGEKRADVERDVEAEARVFPAEEPRQRREMRGARHPQELGETLHRAVDGP